MFTATKIESTIEPKSFESLNNGIWYYNYDVEEKVVKVSSMEGEETEETRYSYVQVRISGEPTLSKCFEAILRAYKDEHNTSLYDVLLSEGTNDQIEDINYNIKVDFNIAPEKSPLDRAKELVLREIDQYDTSPNVNGFTLNGVQVWLSKDTRVGLMNSTTIERDLGQETTELWLGEHNLIIKCDLAIQLLQQLEVYALKCFNVTATHKKEVNSLSTIEEINSYDITKDYPEKLVINI